RRIVEQARQAVERREFERRAVEVDDEREQRPDVEMISQFGAVLPKQHKQTDDQIDQPDEGEIEAALQVLRPGADLKIDVEERLCAFIDALQNIVRVDDGVA